MLDTNLSKIPTHQTLNLNSNSQILKNNSLNNLRKIWKDKIVKAKGSIIKEDMETKDLIIKVDMETKVALITKEDLIIKDLEIKEDLVIKEDMAVMEIKEGTKDSTIKVIIKDMFIKETFLQITKM